MYLLSVPKCFDLKIVTADLNRFICVERTKQCVKNANCLKCVFCSRYLYENCSVTEQRLLKNTVSDKSEAICMPRSTKLNINNLADISVHDLIQSNTSRKLDNVVSNPFFFDNCAYHHQKSLNNSAISTKGYSIMYFNIRSLQKNVIA